jgi:Fic family protein
MIDVKLDEQFHDWRCIMTNRHSTPSEASSSGDGRWPAIGHESHAWQLPDGSYVSKTQRRRVTGPYEAAVAAHIASIPTVPLSKETITLADEATAEIARFDGNVGTLLAPFAAILLRSESAASSKIEQLTASARAIALAEVGVPRLNNASQIVANTRAMEAAIALADHLDPDAIAAMQAALLGGHAPQLVGWREEQVWIGGSNFGPHHATFIPPHHSHVAADIADLVQFLRRDDIPALIQSATAHAQFETIHPFADGNGRTGRALIHALLRARGITANVTVPVSAGLLTDTGAYFEALTSYRSGDPEPIVASLAHATLSAITNGGTLVDELRAIRLSWGDRIKARRDSVAWRIADHLLAQPAITWRTLERDFAVGATSTYRAIDRLVDAEVLTEVSGKGWGRIWTAPEVLTALDAFAERAGRRVRG